MLGFIIIFFLQLQILLNSAIESLEDQIFEIALKMFFL